MSDNSSGMAPLTPRPTSPELSAEAASGESTAPTTKRMGVAATSAPASLFQGINSVTGQALDTVVTGLGDVKEYPSGQNVMGGVNVSDFQVVTSYESLCSTLRISAKASVAFGATGQVSAKMKFVNDLKMSTYGIVAIAYARRCEGTHSATAYGFKDEKTFQQLQSDPGGFAAVHGDSWVNAVDSGGEYYGAYSFFCRSKSEQRSLMTKMTASTGDAAARFKSAVNVAIDSHQVEYRSYQEVAGTPVQGLPAPGDLDAMAQYATEFATMDMKTPILYDQTFLGYEKVGYAGDFPTSFRGVAENRGYLIDNNESYAGYLARLDPLINQCNALVGPASANPEGRAGIYAYYGCTEPEVSAILEAAREDRKAITDLFESFSLAPDSPIPRPVEPGSLRKGTPDLRVTNAIPIVPSGNGTEFNDLREHGLDTQFCGTHRRVLRIETYNHDKAVGLLQTSYYDPTCVLGPDQYLVTYRRGNSGYSPNNTLDLKDGQVVTQIDISTAKVKISGDKKWVVNGIRIEYLTGTGSTRTWQTTGGFTGDSTTTTYRYGKQSDGTQSVFIGWTGRAAGNYVYSLYPIHASFDPAFWSA